MHYYYKADTQNENACLKYLVIKWRKDDCQKDGLDNMVSHNVTGPEMSSALETVFCATSYILFFGLLSGYDAFVVVTV